MEQNTETQRIRILPVHAQSFMHALGVAMMRAVAWRETDTGKAFSPKDLYNFAKKYDEEHPLDEYYYYMVSREGAIGISPGLEWLTEWMFIPMEDCKERDFLIMRMKEELREELELENSLEQAVLKGLEAEKAAKEELEVPPPPVVPVSPAEPAQETPPPPPVPKTRAEIYCPSCGTKLPAASKFCFNCGNKLEDIS